MNKPEWTIICLKCKHLEAKKDSSKSPGVVIGLGPKVENIGEFKNAIYYGNTFIPCHGDKYEEKLEIPEAKIGMADVVILTELTALESALLRAVDNPYLEVDVKPLLKEVGSKVGPLSCKIRKALKEKDEMDLYFKTLQDLEDGKVQE